MSGRVAGVGGVFFRARDLAGLADWYRTHPRLEIGPGRWHVFESREHDDPHRAGSTVWSLFAPDTAYLGPGRPEFMLNYRVDDLDGLLARLRDEGARIDGRRHEDENGRFAWITDLQGHRIELWQPAPGH